MPDTRTEALYLTADGHYHKRTCKIPTGLANVAVNGRDNQSHLLDERPIFPLLTAGRVETLDDLIDLEPSEDWRVAEKTAFVVEDQNAFPVSLNPFPSVSDRHHHFVRAYEQGLQRAQIQASRSDLANPYLGPVAVISACIAGLVTVMIALIWAMNRFNGPEAAMLPVLLGAVLSLPRRQSRARATPSRVRRETLYLFCEVTQRVYILSVPFAVLWEKLGAKSRFLPDVAYFRKVSALLGSVLLYGLGMALLSQLWTYQVAAIAGLVLFILPGAGIGWLLGPAFARVANPPIWIAWRTDYDWKEMKDWTQAVISVESDEDDLEFPIVGPRHIVGYTHTHGRGMDSTLFDLQIEAHLGLNVEEAAQNEFPEERPDREGGGLVASGGPVQKFVPVMFNAYFVHDKLNMRDEKDQFRGGLTKGQALEIGGILALAGASIAVLFLVVMSQTGA